MDYDNKYDQSFGRAEIAVMEENEEEVDDCHDDTDDGDDEWNEMKDDERRMEDHFTSEPHWFGGGAYPY